MIRDMRDVDVLDMQRLDRVPSGWSGFASDLSACFDGKPKIQIGTVVYTLSKVPTEAANWWEYRAAAYVPGHRVTIFNT
jgi:hypothetical protein